MLFSSRRVVTSTTPALVFFRFPSFSWSWCNESSLQKMLIDFGKHVKNALAGNPAFLDSKIFKKILFYFC